MTSKPLTIADALQAATHYWDTNDRSVRSRGPNMMPIRASRCADILGRSRKLASLSPKDGASLLVKLREGGLARSSVSSYYAAGRRMLALSGFSCHDWPKAPTAPRKALEAIPAALVEDTLAALEEAGHADTARLVRLMRDTGLRVHVEALRGDFEAEDGRLVIHSGKGGHGRVVPYRGPETGPLLGVRYETHLRRIKEASGGKLKPHDLRRYFITRAYAKSGKDIRVAQVLAGHADPGTTARYIGLDFSQLEAATL